MTFDAVLEPIIRAAVVTYLMEHQHDANAHGLVDAVSAALTEQHVQHGTFGAVDLIPYIPETARIDGLDRHLYLR